MAYPILKAIHIIGFVAWFGGLFYLVRLFVYHVEANQMFDEKGAYLREQYGLMENRVFRIIMNPAMILTWICGLSMLYLQPGFLQEAWMHIKLTLLILLTGYHHYCIPIRKKLQRGEVPMSSFGMRLFNEVPTLILIAIVLVAVLRSQANMAYLFGGLILFALLLYLAARAYRKSREG